MVYVLLCLLEALRREEVVVEGGDTVDWTGLTLIPPAHRVTSCGIDRVTEFTDLWWDILNPTAWLLGLPSVGRYEEHQQPGRRARGQQGGRSTSITLPVHVGTYSVVLA